MAEKGNHISICVCTYRRPELLRRLLKELGKQDTDGLFTYSIVVADNDHLRSAEPLVREFMDASEIRVTYCVEPRQNIALARNKAVENAEGDFIGFIDDDEFPNQRWLVRLFRVCREYNVAGVLGPIKPFYECPPPDWLRKGGFFERPCYATGYRLNWGETRSGNVLFQRNILNPAEVPFRAEFDSAGEDLDFFRRMMLRGHTFLWCNEAIVYEVITSSRCRRAYLLKRALLRGSNFYKHPTDRIESTVKSLIAVPCYTLALPFGALFGQHVVLNYTIKLCDHASRLLALLGWRLMTRRSELA